MSKNETMRFPDKNSDKRPINDLHDKLLSLKTKGRKYTIPKKLCVIYNVPKILSDEVFLFSTDNTENLKIKLKKSLPVQRLETAPNHIILKHEKDWKDETNLKKCRIATVYERWTRCILFTACQVAHENGITITTIWKTLSKTNAGPF